MSIENTAIKHDEIRIDLWIRAESGGTLVNNSLKSSVFPVALSRDTQLSAALSVCPGPTSQHSAILGETRGMHSNFDFEIESRCYEQSFKVSNYSGQP